MEKIKTFLSIGVILFVALALIFGLAEIALYFGRVWGYALSVGLSFFVILACFELYERSK